MQTFSTQYSFSTQAESEQWCEAGHFCEPLSGTATDSKQESVAVTVTCSVTD